MNNNIKPTRRPCHGGAQQANKIFTNRHKHTHNDEEAWNECSGGRVPRSPLPKDHALRLRESQTQGLLRITSPSSASNSEAVVV